MAKTCCAAAGLPVFRITPVGLALAAMLAMASPADAASIGHSRIVSAAGQPLHINVPIRQLSDADQQSLRVSAAPLAAWRQAGLTPPVDLATLQVTVEKGFSADSRVIQVHSSQPFDGPVADLLLQVDTAAGSQQHQVSLLANASRTAPAVAGQPGAGGSAAGGMAAGAPARSQSISVRRGDTLFALARANAVQGVSVYQMMVALQRANPQAFIDGNINLVKAGATLAIPDAAALRAVSDREARRIFQQHAQAYAAYRQGIAARRGEAVQGGSAQRGTVSNGAAAPSAVPAAAAGDQVVLSSGGASDALNDERDATQRNITESEARVSQLERNVQSLNQALQMQGEAAKEAVLEGAAAVGQTLSEAATSIGVAPDDAASGEASPGQAGAAGASASGQGGAASGQPANTGSGPAGSEQGGASSTNGAAAPAAGAGASMPGQAAHANGSPDAGAAGATQAGGAASAGATEAAQAGGSPNAGAAASAGSAAASQTAASQTGASQTGASQMGASSAADEINPSTSSKAGQSVSWLQENLLGVITAILALVVLIIAWVLRRASASRGVDGQGGVTEAMVQERLEKIDLDLDNPPSDARPPHTA